MITLPLLDLTGTLIATAVLSVFWALLSWYCFRRWGAAHPEYASRVVSLVHAIISVIVTAIQFSRDYGKPWGRTNIGMTGDQQFALLVTASYFVVDTIGLFLNDYFDFQFLMHHIGAGGSLFAVMFTQTNGYEMVFTVLVLEFSNPFMHGRWLAIHNNVSPKSWLYIFLDEGFFVTFFLMRVAIGPFLSGSILLGSGPLFWKVATVGVQAVSAMFFFNLVKNRRNDTPWL